MQSMGSAEVHPHSEKNTFVIPNLRKKIVALVQSDAVKPKDGIDPFVNVFGQTFSCDWTALQRGHFLVQMTMVELGLK